MQRKDGHAMLAEGFSAWRRTATPTDGGARRTKWRRSGCDTAFCTSGQGAKVSFAAQAAHVYATHCSVNVSIEAFSRLWLRTTSSCGRCGPDRRVLATFLATVPDGDALNPTCALNLLDQLLALGIVHKDEVA